MQNSTTQMMYVMQYLMHVSVVAKQSSFIEETVPFVGKTWGREEEIVIQDTKFDYAK